MDTQNDGLENDVPFFVVAIVGIYAKFLGCEHILYSTCCHLFSRRSIVVEKGTTDVWQMAFQTSEF